MTSTLQPGFECEYAFDGDVTSWKGWAYDGNVPASIVLNFETPVSMNAVAFKNAVGRAIDVLIGGVFLAVSGVKANDIDSPNINGNIIAFGDNYEDVMISFDTKLDVTAFRITVYSHTGNNGILTEVYALDVEDTNTFVSQDLDSVIKSLDEGKT